jgi:hypothetical protein
VAERADAGPIGRIEIRFFDIRCTPGPGRTLFDALLHM